MDKGGTFYYDAAIEIVMLFCHTYWLRQDSSGGVNFTLSRSLKSSSLAQLRKHDHADRSGQINGSGAHRYRHL